MKRVILILLFSVIAWPSFADTKALVPQENSQAQINDTDPRAILKKTIAAYKAMGTYKSSGTVESVVDMGDGTVAKETSAFTLVLKKPNLYLITWSKDQSQAIKGRGAVWNDGTQPYLYTGFSNSYSKVPKDEIALASAMGISGGIAHTIPSLFLNVFEETPNPIARLTSLKVMASEQVDGEDCYVIQGNSKSIKQEIYWISKSRYLIQKHSRSFETPEGGREMPEFTDDQLAQTLKEMGQEVNDEQIQRMRAGIKKSQEALRNSKMKGTLTAVYLKTTSPDLTSRDFEFTLPADTVLKKSLF